MLDHSYAHLVKNIRNKVKILTVHDLIPLLYENIRISSELVESNKRFLITKESQGVLQN